MTPARILAELPKLSALVVGDVCLDRWCTYDQSAADRSRETGLPRIAVVSTETSAGAGGTVANNLAALGVGRVAVLGAIGADGHGFELLQALSRRGIDSDLLVRTPDIQTFTYTKLIQRSSGVEDRPRVDFINVAPLAAEVESQILELLRAQAGSFDAILVSDQAETSHGGVVTAAMRGLLSELAARHPEKTVMVDSRMRIELFRNLTIKPNRQEAEAACLRAFGTVDCAKLRARTEAPLAMITDGGSGVAVLDANGERWARTKPVANPVDVCGAGDSFFAAAALALRAGATPLNAARFGNLAAGITIMKRGTGTASPEEILAAAGAA